jgi:hypothetical protein
LKSRRTDNKRRRIEENKSECKINNKQNIIEKRRVDEMIETINKIENNQG